MAEKVTLTAVIPTAQYANLQPTIEVEAETIEEARNEALKQMQEFSKMVAEPGKELKVNFGGDTVESNPMGTQTSEINGVEVPYDPATHTYGKGWIGGSTFAHRYEAPFDANMIAGKMASKHDVPADSILDMWKINAEASTSLGTAIHAALELYGKHLKLSMTTKGTTESALHKNPILAPIVESFYAEHKDEDAGYEIFVADAEKKLCGFIDRLKVVDRDKKIVRVQDYKTNPDINKKKAIVEPFKKVIENTQLGLYWLQLSFYAYILAKAGYTVEGLDIFNYDGTKWVTYQHDVIDISGAV